MAKVEDCPGFETFGADVKEARKAKNLARKDLAEKVNIDTRYLANIENEGTKAMRSSGANISPPERRIRNDFAVALTDM